MSEREDHCQSIGVVRRVIVKGGAVLLRSYWLKKWVQMITMSWTYTFGIMVNNENVGTVSGYPTTVFKVTEVRNSSAEEGVLQSRSVAEPLRGEWMLSLHVENYMTGSNILLDITIAGVLVGSNWFSSTVNYLLTDVNP